MANIRDAATLAKLPAHERAGFTQLWVDVAALVKRPQEKGEIVAFAILE